MNDHPPVDADRIGNDTPASNAPVTLQEAATDAVRYWEPRRVVYNVLLAMIALIHAAPPLLQGRFHINVPMITTVLFLAIGANICYCAAYLVELVMQFTSFREVWHAHRGKLFLLGCVFAGLLAWTISSAASLIYSLSPAFCPSGSLRRPCAF